MKKIIFIVVLFAVAALFTTYSFSSNTASSGLKDSTKCKMNKTDCKMNKSDCKMGAEGCKMDKADCKMGAEGCKMDKADCKMGAEGCKMDKADCKMGAEGCKMDKSKCNKSGGNKCTCEGCTCSTGGECKCTDCKDCKSECCKKTDCKKNTSGGMKSGVVDTTKNKVCPVSGEALDGAEGDPVTYTYLGKEYTFCCAGCVNKFKKEPMNYIKEELTCPVMGEAASKEVSTLVDGVKYYFCCAGCISKFEKNPDKYLKK